jgi:Cu-Zn family superoxide dismutase
MYIWDLFVKHKDPSMNYRIALAILLIIICAVIWFNATIWNELKQFVYKTDSSAVCVISPTAECPNVIGSVTFHENNKKGTVNIKFNLHGLTPGEHGVHIHEFGDLRPASVTDSAKLDCCGRVGEHYNPFYSSHGSLDTGHAGDFGNILADINGNVFEQKESTTVKLRGVHSIVGRALVIHDKKDDLGHGNDSASKVNGNSGARVACGVVGYAQ